MNVVKYSVLKFLGIVTDIKPVELMPGAVPDPGIDSALVWTGGRNVHFDNNTTRRADGYSALAEPLPNDSKPIFQLCVLLPDIVYWIWVDNLDPAAPRIWVTDGAFHHNITPSAGLTGGGVGEWTGTVLNGVPVLNNGLDAPIWWNGDTNSQMESLPDWPANTFCKSVRAFKFHLLAMNVTQDGVTIQERVMWSDSADAGTIPDTWTPGPENDAGDTILAATPGGIVDGEKLRDVFVMYKQHSSYTVQYVGGQFVFNFQPLFVTSGIQALNCVKELRGYHVVFADDDVVRHDGNTYESIVDKKVRQTLFEGISPDNQHMCHLTIRVPTDEVWIVAPTVDSVLCDTALVYSFTDGVFGNRALPDVAFVADGIVPREPADFNWDNSTDEWNFDTRVWNEANYSITSDRLIMTQPELGKIYHVGGSHDNDGEPLEAWVERRDFTIGGEPNIWTNAIVRSLYPVITGSQGDEIEVRFAATKRIDQPVEWGMVRKFKIGDQIKIDNLTHGRYLNLRISSKGGNEWELARVGVEYVEKAKY